MTKPWIFAPCVAVLALVASVWWWQKEKNRWTPPVARLPDLPSIVPMPAPVRVLARQALALPLFWESRRPVEVVDGKKGNLVKELQEARLTAVLESGKDRVAILVRADGTSLKITNATKPWRVESFDGRKAVFFSAGAPLVEKPLEVLAPSAAIPSKPVAPRARQPSAAP